MKLFVVSLLLLCAFLLVGCGRGPEDDIEVIIEENGRNALAQMLGLELTLPPDARVLVESDRAAVVVFSPAPADGTTRSILSQLEAAGYTTTPTEGLEGAENTPFVGAMPLSYMCKKDGKRFNIVFQNEAGVGEVSVTSFSIYREQ